MNLNRRFTFVEQWSNLGFVYIEICGEMKFVKREKRHNMESMIRISNKGSRDIKENVQCIIVIFSISLIMHKRVGRKCKFSILKLRKIKSKIS